MATRSSGETGKERGLLPFDRARWFAGDVDDDAVDLGYFVGDAGGDALQDVVREARPVGGHGVLTGHRAQNGGVTVRASVALDAHRAYVGEEDDRELPDVAVETCPGELLAGDRVGL